MFKEFCFFQNDKDQTIQVRVVYFNLKVNMDYLRFLDHIKLRNLEKFLLLFCDIVSFLLAIGTTQYLRKLNPDIHLYASIYVLLPLTIVLITNHIFDLYKIESQIRDISFLGRMILSIIFASLCISFSVYLLGVERFIGDYFGRGVLLGTMVGFFILGTGHRFLISWFFHSVRTQRNYLVMSTGKEFQLLLKENESLTNKEQFNFLEEASWENLPLKIKEASYVGIIINSKVLKRKTLMKDLMKLRLDGIRIFDIHNFFESIWLKIPIISLEDQWFVMENGFDLIHSPLSLRLKRMLDTVLSLILLILLAPLMLFIGVLIKIHDFGPIIYSQVRTGEKGKTFTIYKFRSMTVSAEEKGQAKWASKHDPRITRVGKILRLTRMDELPQLWNVFKGNMSFIGPRPERPEFNKILEKEIPYYNLRHLVKPGITGWAQVLYPYGAGREDALEKLQYDFYYIKNYSLLLDFSVLIKTIRVVLMGKGR